MLKVLAQARGFRPVTLQPGGWTGQQGQASPLEPNEFKASRLVLKIVNRLDKHVDLYAEILCLDKAQKIKVEIRKLFNCRYLF